MTVEDLLQTNWNSALYIKILESEPPENVKLKLEGDQVIRALDNLYELLKDNLVNNTPFPNDVTEKYDDKEQVQSRYFLVLSSYLSHLFIQWITEEKTIRTEMTPKVFNLDRIGAFALIDVKGDEESQVCHLRSVLFHFLLLACYLYFLKSFHTYPLPQSHIGKLEYVIHRNLYDLYIETRQTCSEYGKLATERLYSNILELTKTIYQEAPTWNKKTREGIFSAIKLEELNLLAVRHSSVEEQYGKKQVEKHFEQQLALIMQSFGFYVVSTRTGYSTVDLVCISSNSDERLTFLLEAKTSRSPYSLPKKDSRALKEYIFDIKRSLSSFPPLSFVLIVGGDSTKTIPDKIKALEGETQIPVKFIKAKYLARLRDDIPGPMPVNQFKNLLTTSDTVVTEKCIEELIEAYVSEQRAHIDFVESMLSAKGIIPTGGKH